MLILTTQNSETGLTHPSPAAVLGLRHVFGHWMAFIKANCHGIPNSHL